MKGSATRERSESETIILVNKEDTKEGYFNYSTSVQSDFNRMVKRIGGVDKLLQLRVDKDPRGRIRWWDAKVPNCFLLKSLGIRKAKSKVETTAEETEKTVAR